MRHNFIFNGKSLRDLGFYISPVPRYNIAPRAFDVENISGLDGSIIEDKGYYENVEESYEIVSVPCKVSATTTPELVNLFAAWLSPTVDSLKYCILRDTYHPGYFTYAFCKKIDEITVNADRCISTTVTFSRKAFWYSDVGTKSISVTVDGIASGSAKSIAIHNPEKYVSLPKITIYGKGALTLQSDAIRSLTLSARDLSPITLDSETQNATFSGSYMYNPNSYVSGTSFPRFTAGKNTLSIAAGEDGAFTKIEIIPRWRRL